MANFRTSSAMSQASCAVIRIFGIYNQCSHHHRHFTPFDMNTNTHALKLSTLEMRNKTKHVQEPGSFTQTCCILPSTFLVRLVTCAMVYDERAQGRQVQTSLCRQADMITGGGRINAVGPQPPPPPISKGILSHQHISLSFRPYHHYPHHKVDYTHHKVDYTHHTRTSPTSPSNRVIFSASLLSLTKSPTL